MYPTAPETYVEIDQGTPDEGIKRSDQLIRLAGRYPFNSEPPLNQLMASWITPTPLHYTRTHGNTPRLDWETHQLRVDGKKKKKVNNFRNGSARIPFGTTDFRLTKENFFLFLFHKQKKKIFFIPFRFDGRRINRFAVSVLDGRTDHEISQRGFFECSLSFLWLYIYIFFYFFLRYPLSLSLLFLPCSLSLSHNPRSLTLILPGHERFLWFFSVCVCVCQDVPDVDGVCWHTTQGTQHPQKIEGI